MKSPDLPVFWNGDPPALRVVFDTGSRRPVHILKEDSGFVWASAGEGRQIVRYPSEYIEARTSSERPAVDQGTLL